jgi:predicted RecA/RadA family phage recombinase
MAIATIVRYGYTIPYTPGSAVAAGDVVDLGTFAAVAVLPIAANVLGELHCGWDSPTVRITKYTGDEIAQGAIVYWDAGTSTATGTVGYSEGVLGYAASAAATGDDTVDVKMAPP